MNQYRFGTREWAAHNHNICIGCKHACKYCYARFNAVKRFKTVATESEWIDGMKLNDKKLNQKPKRYNDGRIMFPTQHDIVPKFIDETVTYLDKWLVVGNDILIVSKPHLECVKRICDDLAKYKNQIVFRFTIGSINDDVLKFWEPNAPNYQERVKSLMYAFQKGFETSISAEPKLDCDISLMIKFLLPGVTDTIWIGNLNFMNQRVDFSNWKSEDYKYKKMVEDAQTLEFTKDLYNEFKDNPKVKWKESIKKMLGLPDDGVG